MMSTEKLHNRKIKFFTKKYPGFFYIISFVLIIATYYVLSALYVELVYPIFNFGSMSYDPRDNRLFEISLLLITAIFMPAKVKAPSDLYNWLYFIILIIPSAVLSSEQGSNRFHFFLMVAALWILMLFQRLISSVLKHRAIENLTAYRHLPYRLILFFIITILLFLVLVVRGDFNLNMSKVYQYRFDIAQNMPFALRYLLPISAISLISYLSALAFHRKDFKILFLIIILGVLFFGFSSHKAMLFYPFASIAGYYFLKMSRPYLLMMTCIGVISIITILYPHDEFGWLGAMFANRIIFMPSQINFHYFDYFSNNAYMLWAESKISFGLVTSELPMDVMHYIGGMITGDYDIRANTGWVANAYMNAGIIGIIIYAIIICAIFYFIDYWAKLYGMRFVGAAFLVPITNFIMTADLFITLMTSGLIFLLLIFQITTVGIQIRKRNCFKIHDMIQNKLSNLFHNCAR